MSRSLYRFRSTDALLRTYKELENQEIFFASPHELNDPMEAYRDIQWRGDDILWSNLLRHYVRNLTVLSFGVNLARQGIFLTREQLQLFDFEYRAGLHRTLLPRAEKALLAFFADENVLAAVTALGQLQVPLGREALWLILTPIHAFAQFLVEKALGPDYGMFEPPDDRGERWTKIAKLLKGLPSVIAAIADAAGRLGSTSEVGDFFGALSNISLQQELALRVRLGQEFPGGWIQETYLKRYPEEFLRALEHLTFPRRYLASFSENCTDSFMWSHYSDYHRGVCLKFRFDDENGKLSLPLSAPVGLGEDGKPLIQTVSMECVPVNYSETFPTVDFFRSLGMIPRDVLMKQWYRAPDGRASDRVTDVILEDPTWRDQYWSVYGKHLTHKLLDWQHEREYRLLLNSMDLQLRQSAQRKCVYLFERLEGIVFGMQTSIADKLAILKLIEQKCAKSGRTDFQFFEANYSARLRSIEAKPMSLLKLAKGS